jgi:hypothetical protein
VIPIFSKLEEKKQNRQERSRQLQCPENPHIRKRTMLISGRILWRMKANRFEEFEWENQIKSNLCKS